MHRFKLGRAGMRTAVIAATLVATILAEGAGVAQAVVDVALGEFYNMQVATNPSGRVAPYNGLTVRTVSCNVGTERITWQAQMNSNHPMISFALYRLEGGRLVQIGISWTKHGFFALDQSLCTTCTDPNGGSGLFLGVNCSDTYDVTNNQDRFYLGPRSEINPWTAGWSPCSSYFDNAWGTAGNCTQAGVSPTFDGLAHRMKVHDDDLNQTMHAGAIYYMEASYLIQQPDANRMNNIGWRRMQVNGTPGSYSFTNLNPDGTAMAANHAGRTPTYGPALASVWGQDHLTLNTSQTPIASDGEVYLASTATNLGGGNWHYEYAMYNYNFDHAVSAISIPISPCITVSNTGMRDWTYSVAQGSSPWAAEVDGLDWAPTVSGGNLTWSDTSGANPLRWGQLFNFWFDAPAPPGSSTVIITTSKPSSPSTVSGALQGPLPVYAKRDVNGDAMVNSLDVAPFVDALLNGTANPYVFCAADVDNSTTLDGNDIQLFINGL